MIALDFYPNVILNLRKCFEKKIFTNDKYLTYLYL